MTGALHGARGAQGEGRGARGEGRGARGTHTVLCARRGSSRASLRVATSAGVTWGRVWRSPSAVSPFFASAQFSFVRRGLTAACPGPSVAGEHEGRRLGLLGAQGPVRGGPAGDGMRTRERTGPGEGAGTGEGTAGGRGQGQPAGVCSPPAPTGHEERVPPLLRCLRPQRPRLLPGGASPVETGRGTRLFRAPSLGDLRPTCSGRSPPPSELKAQAV